MRFHDKNGFMLRLCLAALSLAAISASGQSLPEDLVHPLTGTQNEGQTYPAVGVPFAMTHWTPQTRAGETKCIAPYYFTDAKIQGLRGSHFLSGSCVPDYGTITLMAGTGSLKTDAVMRASSFSRETEHATPYSYRVELNEAHVKASVTATSRAGILRFEFTKDDPDAWVVVENNARGGDGWVQVDAAKKEVTAEVPVRREYAGSGKLAGFSAWFVAQFDRPVKSAGSYIGPDTFEGRNKQVGDGKPVGVVVVPKMMTSTGGASAAAMAQPTSAPRPGFGAYLHFGPVHRGDVVIARIGTSFVSMEEARKNLRVEIPDWNFEKVEAAARSAWHDQLGRIQIAGNDPAKAVFYTSLYHAMLQPRTYSDVSGAYPRFHDHGAAEHTATTQYDDFSVWDIFRAQAPLMMILDPKREAAMMQSIITKGEQGGFLPIFPAWNSFTSEMVGDHSSAMMIDAWRKGIRGFDMQRAYPLMRKNALEMPATREEYRDGKGRRGLDSYIKYGYIPLEDPIDDAFHKNEQVSRTLEYAYDDAMLATIAQELGHADDAALFRKRGENWRNVIDPETGFARGRHIDGSWATPFDPAKAYTWITEGLPWQYTFFVPQNVAGLIELEGGKAKFEARLDELFAGKFYEHGNEPSHHIAYLYDFAGAPQKTQKHVRAILDSEYKDGPAGLAGNDDAGQMSGWYVLSALGFYQVCPGVPEYSLGSPRFDDITVTLPNARKLHVIATGAESGKVYAQHITLNGKPITNSTLTHAQIMAGGELRFSMSATPEN
jgi:predicted alpha-1,2-mannosidase